MHSLNATFVSNVIEHRRFKSPHSCDVQSILFKGFCERMYKLRECNGCNKTVCFLCDGVEIEEMFEGVKVISTTC
jgi:hypothetical protein